MQTTDFLRISPKNLVIFARCISSIGNRSISCRDRKLKIEMTAYRHCISVTETGAIKLALITDAALIFKIVFSGFGICAKKVAVQAVFGLEPPSRFTTYAEESGTVLIVCLTPCPPRELVVIQNGNPVFAERQFDREVGQRQSVVKKMVFRARIVLRPSCGCCTG